jgi:hypothetical protein
MHSCEIQLGNIYKAAKTDLHDDARDDIFERFLQLCEARCDIILYLSFVVIIYLKNDKNSLTLNLG